MNGSLRQQDEVLFQFKFRFNFIGNKLGMPESFLTPQEGRPYVLFLFMEWDLPVFNYFQALKMIRYVSPYFRHTPGVPLG
jgi:hypothetical protein